MAEDETYAAPESGESRGIYTISQIPIQQLGMLENAKTLFRLNLNPQSDLMETGFSLLNVVTLQEEIIKKQFPGKDAKGEYEADKIKIDDMNITDYREEIETALIKNDLKLLHIIVLHRISHNCNLIFDSYMVNLNDALPMRRRNPKEKMEDKLFALVPNAKPAKIVEEYNKMNEERMGKLKKKAKP